MDINKMKALLENEGFDYEQIIKIERIVVLTMNDDRQLPSTDIDRTEDVIKRFLAAKKLKGLKASTLKSYRHSLNKLYSYTNTILEATTDDIRYFLAMLASTNSAVSLDNNRRNLSSFYKWAYREKFINENPMERIDRVKTEKIIKLPFQSSDIEKLKDAANTCEEKAFLHFLLSTGVRCSEITSIPLSRINFNTKEVIVMGKGAKERKVYMNDACMIHIENYLNERRQKGIQCEYLFMSERKYNGKYSSMSNKRAEHMVQNIGKRVGIDDIYIHRFRRHFCCNLIRLGCSLTTIQQLMGHESISTTQHYISISDQTVKDEFLKLCA